MKLDREILDAMSYGVNSSTLAAIRADIAEAFRKDGRYPPQEPHPDDGKCAECGMTVPTYVAVCPACARRISRWGDGC